ncbi:MAG: cell division protein ZapA [Ignavibacteria bacterium]|nr:cell division protein ZapA [Ignavibacteria bacterium]
MKTFNLNVFGSDYKIKTDRNGDYVLNIGKIVDEKMKLIHRQYPQGSLAKTAVVSCINIVDDYLARETEQNELINRRINSLIEKLERIV